MRIQINRQTRTTQTVLIPFTTDELYELARQKITPEKMQEFKDSKIEFVICDPEGFEVDFVEGELYLTNGNHVLCVRLELRTEKEEREEINT